MRVLVVHASTVVMVVLEVGAADNPSASAVLLLLPLIVGHRDRLS